MRERYGSRTGSASALIWPSHLSTLLDCHWSFFRQLGWVFSEAGRFAMMAALVDLFPASHNAEGASKKKRIEAIGESDADSSTLAPKVGLQISKWIPRLRTFGAGADMVRFSDWGGHDLR